MFQGNSFLGYRTKASSRVRALVGQDRYIEFSPTIPVLVLRSTVVTFNGIL